jgi:hypothetical protein
VSVRFFDARRSPGVTVRHPRRHRMLKRPRRMRMSDWNLGMTSAVRVRGLEGPRENAMRMYSKSSKYSKIRVSDRWASSWRLWVLYAGNGERVTCGDLCLEDRVRRSVSFRRGAVHGATAALVWADSDRGAGRHHTKSRAARNWTPLPGVRSGWTRVRVHGQETMPFAVPRTNAGISIDHLPSRGRSV